MSLGATARRALRWGLGVAAILLIGLAIWAIVQSALQGAEAGLGG